VGLPAKITPDLGERIDIHRHPHLPSPIPQTLKPLNPTQTPNPFAKQKASTRTGVCVFTAATRATPRLVVPHPSSVAR
jgi:hypothetical protein